MFIYRSEVIGQITPTELGGEARPSQDTDNKLDQWLIYENDEDFREHLPLLFQWIVERILCWSVACTYLLICCILLLVNTWRYMMWKAVMEKTSSRLCPVEEKYTMWENEDPTVVKTKLPSAVLLSALAQSMVGAIFFQGYLRETWGD